VAEVRRILDQLEFHYTPFHGSWLNMTEIEINLYTRSVLRDVFPMQRLPGQRSLYGLQIPIRRILRLMGSSPRIMLASIYITSIPQLMVDGTLKG
jgi:hypothetical protein